MLSNYKQTELECWIEELYMNHGILSPSDLRIENIASQLTIEIVYMEGPNRAIWDNDQAVIFLDPYQAKNKVREVFFHELCHPLRHFGNQMDMALGTFRELQEIQAKQFQLYAALPYFMIKQLELPSTEAEIITLFTITFGISKSIAKQRLEQIKRRIYQTESDIELKSTEEPVYNYSKNIQRKPIPDHAKALVELAIYRKKAKEA